MVKNASHTLAYSLIALQEMNLAYHYPIIFWNCACLINDAGGDEEEEIDEEAIEVDKAEEPYTEEMDWFDEDEDKEESSYEEDDGENGYPATIVITKDGKKKKKLKVTNYGKIASAIGKIQSAGITIAPPNINLSTYTFSPDVDNNCIRYGLSGITRIGGDLIKAIISNRPYNNLNDFLTKVKVNKPQVINLIKSGAFDSFDERVHLMRTYVESISDVKKRLTMQNARMLIDSGLIPTEYDLEKRIFNFNKYLKGLKKDGKYLLDEIAFDFFEPNFSIDSLSPNHEAASGFEIDEKKWDKIYKAYMEHIKTFIKSHHDELLNELNEKLISDVWNKYCIGSISKWEMDSISCYIHSHELSEVDLAAYRLDRFDELSSTPVIDRIVYIRGRQVPLFKLNRIVGTVLDRNKAKKTVTLLTTSGVVSVKIYGAFAQYDQQISERDSSGKKHVLRKSEFARGNKIIVTGIRIEDDFIAKKYSNTSFHLVETIESIKDGKLVINNRNDD